VYFDDRYPSDAIAVPGRLAEKLELHGFQILDADGLRNWMIARVEAGAAGSVCILAQDILPDTIAEQADPSCTLRRYLDAGGRVVWLGGWPCHNQGRADGTRTNWNQAGQAKILGISRGDWLDDRPVLTEEGEKWGLSQVIPRTPSGGTVQPTQEVTLVLARVGKHCAASWLKNFNPKYPLSGFLAFSSRYFPCEGELIAELARVAVYGLEGAADSPASPATAHG
jgi:hypothetical protein